MIGIVAGLVQGASQWLAHSGRPAPAAAGATPTSSAQSSLARPSAEALLRTTDIAVPTASDPSATTGPSVDPTRSATSTAQPTPAPTLEAVDKSQMSTDSPDSLALPVTKPAIIGRVAWGAAKPSHAFVRQRPQYITLHHEGVLFNDTMSAPEYLQRVQHWSITNRKWPDIPYHFMIDRTGNIYEGRPLDARGDTNTAYDLQDHALIAVLGKYDAGEQQPHPAQIKSMVMLMAWIADTCALSADSIRGHRDYIPLNKKGKHIDPRTGENITCPGDNLYRYLLDGSIQNAVDQILTQAQRHHRSRRPYQGRKE